MTTQMQQFTPGPWEVGDFEDVWTPGSLEGKAGGRIYAPGWCRAERTANARLIAAAPELYEALERALYVLETVAQSDGYDTSVGVVPEARALLARIRGDA